MRWMYLGMAGALALATVTQVQAAPMNQQDCDALWKQINPQNVEKLPEATAMPHLTDLKTVNPDGDNTIEKDEFSAACAKGLVKSSAAGGTKQPAAGETSDRTPEQKTPTPQDQVDSKDGATSDRTPEQ
jgi:hypothetical protein